MMRIIPVIDVMDGQAVRAIGGRRELYAPVQSKLTDSTEPMAVARAMLAAAQVDELYVADIDAIQGHRPRLGWVKELTDGGTRVMVDSGVKTAADAIPIVAAGAAVVVGTETLLRFDELHALVRAWEPDRVHLSIDMRNGRVLGNENAWGATADAASVIDQCLPLGINRFLVLELARVGTGVGPGTVELCRQLRQRFSNIELLAGGGVRNRTDVDQLIAAGASGVLTASALHDGEIAPRFSGELS